ncbi:uncharacterized protein ATNIH1004_009356 [Aspergillus tanneri]|uniref:Uncharacterized protein n=1 Tax=Aspergillus tanneri TaxID=1220188 RepID=A0A5M9ML30_9EURO|nr:uncharacterized protein ATNIH1004_009356 [Aspergillus tanneri]KAA8645139.1 hypothetical protein ATNIH1004_009356 [Aspergillus tanneri]
MILTALATLRMAVGFGLISIPRQVGAVFLLPYTPEVAITARMAGGRDFTVAALLFACRDQAIISGETDPVLKNARQGQRLGWTATQRALMAGMVVDGIDILNVVIGYLEGTLSIEGNNDSSFQVLFASYVCIAIAAVAQATFLPTIVHTSMHFSTQKPKLYTAIVNLVVVPLYWTYLLHSGWTRERMWHSIVTFAFSIHCYQYRPTAALTPTDTYNVSYPATYSTAFLGQPLLLAQLVLFSYRSATLYGAIEQTVGTSITVAVLSIASIIATDISES